MAASKADKVTADQAKRVGNTKAQEVAINAPKASAEKASAKAVTNREAKARNEVTHRADTNPVVEPDIAVAPVESEGDKVEAVDGRKVKGVVREDGVVREAAAAVAPPECERISTGRADTR